MSPLSGYYHVSQSACQCRESVSIVALHLTRNSLFFNQFTSQSGGLDKLSADAAERIALHYIRNGSTGRPDNASSRRVSNIIRRIEEEEEDDDDDEMCSCDYIYPPSSPTVSRATANCSEIDSIENGDIFAPARTSQREWAEHFSVKHSKNALKLIGSPVNQVTEVLDDLKLKSAKGSPDAIIVSPKLFDNLDKIVFGYLKDTHWAPFRNSFWWIKYHQFLCISSRNVTCFDFITFRVLGKGGFGMVNACKNRSTGKIFAMKRLHKRGIKMKKAEAHCIQERLILAKIHSSFVVYMRYAYSTPTDLYIILDLMTGGDLGFHLCNRGRFTVNEARYYAARTLMGLADMHENNIAHRDLKPENILMDEDGHTKISDLGLASSVGEGITGTCGTRGYWAPEMLRRNAQCKKELYTVSVDWFSFGCCLYEFIHGVCPFRTDRARDWGDFPKDKKADRDRAIDLAVQQMEPEYSDVLFEPVLKDLISKLLIKDGKKRLGANGYREVAAHPWFKGTCVCTLFKHALYQSTLFPSYLATPI